MFPGYLIEEYLSEKDLATKNHKVLEENQNKERITQTEQNRVVTQDIDKSRTKKLLRAYFYFLKT